MNKLIRIYCECNLLSDCIISLNTSQSHYLANVMRKQILDKLKLFNNVDGEWLCEIINISKKEVIIRVISQIKKAEKESNINLIFAVIKNSRLPYVIEKATEIGVNNIFPIITEKTNHRFFNLQKAKLISLEASEQCGRITIPKIHEAQSMNNLLKNWNNTNIILFCDEEQNALPIYDILSKFDSSYNISILVGPEGGFSKEERIYLRNLSFIMPVHLGKNILRAETASIAALSFTKMFLYK